MHWLMTFSEHGFYVVSHYPIQSCAAGSCASALVALLLFRIHTILQKFWYIFLLSFLRVGHLNFMRILARCRCRRWVSIRSEWLTGWVCRGDRGESSILVRRLDKISRDRLMPLLAKCVAVLAINSSVRGLEHYLNITLPSRHNLGTTCAELHNPSSYYNTPEYNVVSLNARYVQISNYS